MSVHAPSDVRGKSLGDALDADGPRPAHADRTSVAAPRGRDPEELELKLNASPEQLAAVCAEIEPAGPMRTFRLQAHYFDTPDDRLAAAGLSLRLRLEGGRWLQTLKMSTGGGNLRRAEHEVELGPDDEAGPPALDLDRHRDTAAGRVAAQALAAAASAPHEAGQLVRRYGTQVVRRTTRMKLRGSTVEVALDEGRVDADGREEPICEVELELESGSPQALARLARKWVRRHGLWLAHESKGERGRRLAVGASRPAVVKARPSRLAPPMSPDALTRAVVAGCLEHILPNAAAVAGGSIDHEHIHQLRVGIRRLRTALRELEGLSKRLPTHIEAPLARVFRVLGEQRDQDAVLAAVRPKLIAAGAPGVRWASADGAEADLAAAAREPDFQCALIDAAEFALSEGRGSPESAEALRKRVRPMLRRLHDRIAKRGARFEALAVEKQHDLRKRLKRLRYLTEFVSPLFEPAAVERYLDSLRPAQDVLGENNDLAVARDLAKRSTGRDPDARFALKWLRQAQRKTSRRAGRILSKVSGADRFWAAPAGRARTMA